MSDKPKNYVYNRKFLNPKKGLASIEWHVEDYKSSYNEGYTIDGDVTISDCSRTITLDFFSSSDEDVHAAIYKIEYLMMQLEEFKRNFYSAVKRLEDNKAASNKAD